MSTPSKAERLIQMVSLESVDEFMKAISDDDEVREWVTQMFSDTIKETVEDKEDGR